ncbi:hypothetical protein [Streptomyces sp. NPDC059874]|uniref:hypothetical protein n=1 Tax=Streptomyces sp. NPDC059874 TaxID=3346983 RepID=UPI00365D0ED5
MRRYTITKRPISRQPNGAPVLTAERQWVIFDEWLGAYCTLPANAPKGEAPTLLPLEFKTRLEAETWMAKCYATWAEWSQGYGADRVPKHWRGFIPPVKSPWLIDQSPGGRYEPEAWTLHR